MASISAIAFLTRPWKMLKAMTAGMRHQEADGGRDQRLGDAGHHRAGARPPVARQLVERLDDAEDGAEEADEGRVVAERAEDTR